MSNYNQVVKLLTKARQAGILVSIENDRLKLRSQKGRHIDTTLVSDIRNNEEVIIDLLKTESKEVNSNDPTRIPITAFDRHKIDNIPLSYAQEGLWFLDQLSGSTEYHIPMTQSFDDNLNVDAMFQALNSVVNRHEILRTTYREDSGRPFQVILPKNEWSWTYDPFPKPKKELKNWLSAVINQPFDLTKDHPLRAHLVKVEETRFYLVVIFHHIAADAWSINTLKSEVLEFYKASIEKRHPRLKSVEIQYADYALWQRQNLFSSNLDKQLEYWESQLIGAKPVTFPTDYLRKGWGGKEGSSCQFSLNKELTANIIEMCKERRITLFMFLLAAIKVLIYKHTDHTDICIGTPFANRRNKSVENIIGFFVNTVVLRSQIDVESSFSLFLDQIRETTLKADQYQDVPFEFVVDRVGQQRTPGGNPLFDIMFVHQNAPSNKNDEKNPLASSTNNSSASSNYQSSKFDLTFTSHKTTNEIQFNIQFRTSLFKPATINLIRNRLTQLLTNVVSDPNQKIRELEVIDPIEKDFLLFQLNNTKAEHSASETVLDLWNKQVLRYPNRIAIEEGIDSLTYKELDIKSNKLAALLRKKGIDHKMLVGIFLDRSIEFITSIFGVLKTGAAYVPIDPSTPKTRIEHLLADINRFVLSRVSLSEQLDKNKYEVIELDKIEGELSNMPSLTIGPNISSESLAYVIYTSGSTGRPKGVMIEQKALVNYLHFAKKTYVDEGGTDFPLFTSVAFDLTITSIYVPLLTGNKILIPKDNNTGILIEKIIQENKVNAIKLTPSHLSILSECNLSFHLNQLNLKKLIVGGEQLNTKLAQRVYKKFEGKVAIFNEYGPTEATVGCMIYQYNPTDETLSVPIGLPIDNTQIYILDQHKNLVPVGAIGEMYIGGDGLSCGYLNKPELTSEKFGLHPSLQQRLYRTGDLARWLPEGKAEFIGRFDDQVKIRGHRVELGEIESVFLSSPLIKSAVILDKEDKNGNKYLVAYIIPETAYHKQSLENYLKNELPSYMVPGSIIEIPAFPLNANGKIDRSALPKPNQTLLSEKEYVSARNIIEKQLVGIWETLLGRAPIGIHDNFFEIKGNSLLAAQMIAQARKKLRVELEIRDVFNHSTIASLAQVIKGKEKGELILPDITLVKEKPSSIPLSFSQERLWYLDQLKGSVEYHVPLIKNFGPTLNVPFLEHAIKLVIERHEVLRTVIKDKAGKPYQEVHTEKRWNLDLENGHFESKALKRDILDYISSPFDLAYDYPVRAKVFKRGNEGFVLILVLHHIAVDGWSVVLFEKEVMHFYEALIENRTVNLPKLPFQYSDYAIWQRKTLSGAYLEKKLAGWEKMLNGANASTFPEDFSRPKLQSNKGSSINIKIPIQLQEDLKRFCQREGVTTFMFLLATLKVLLYRYTGLPDITIGTPVANRRQSELESIIGFVVNTLALRTQFDKKATFSELLTRVEHTTLEAFSLQEIPFEKVVNKLVKDRDPSRSPLFQVLFVLDNISPGVDAPSSIQEQKSKDLKVSGLFEVSKFDLTFTIKESTGNINIQYCTDLYKQQTTLNIGHQYIELLANLLNAPNKQLDDYQFTPKEELRKIKDDFNQTAVGFPKSITMVDLFENQVMNTPNKPATSFAGQELYYQELNNRANQLASYLKRRGIKQESLVGIFMTRSLDMIISILAIIKAGGAYVPIDPDYPSARIEYILSDLGNCLVLSRSEFENQLNSGSFHTIYLDKLQEEINKEPTDNLSIDISPSNLLYVIYTSGSTGNPKGVMNQHSGLVNRLLWAKNYFQVQPEDIFIQKTTYSFDVSVWELLLPVISGSRLVFARPGGEKDVDYLKKAIDQHQVTTIHFVPSMLEVFLLGIQLGDCKSLKKVICSGEALKRSQALTFREKLPHVKLYNLYGPTEAAIDVTYFDVTEDVERLNQVPIGKPVANTTLHILDLNGHAVPIGIPGELHIGGVQVARGYLNKEKLTREKFIPNMLKGVAGKVLYKTGDIAKWCSDGNIAFLGRKDHQIKLRGFRIELGEIENAFMAHQSIDQCTVMVKENQAGTPMLVAYVVSKEKFDEGALKKHLRSQLPNYMVPNNIVEMDEMPLTSNGKINRKALPNPEEVFYEAEVAYLPSRNKLESLLVNTFKQILSLNKVGVLDNFYDLGGDSLSSIRVATLLKQEGYQLPVIQILKTPVIEDLAIYLSVNPKKNHQPNSKPDTINPNEIVGLTHNQLAYFNGTKYRHAVGSFFLTISNFDPDKWRRSLENVFNKIPLLRTRIFLTSQGLSQQCLEQEKFSPFVEFLSLEENNDMAAIQSYISKVRSIPFDLENGVGVRTYVFSNTEKALIFVMLHHSLTDFTSNRLIRELLEADYLGKNPFKNQDLTHWEYIRARQMFLKSDVAQQKMSYWESTLKPLKHYSNSPLVGSNKLYPKGHKLFFYNRIIDQERLEKLRDFCRNKNHLTSCIILAIVFVEQYLINGIDLPVVKMTMNGRDMDSPGIDISHAIGQFTNTLPLILDMTEEMTLETIIEKTSQQYLQAKTNQEIPYQNIAATLNKVSGKNLDNYISASLNYLDESAKNLEYRGNKHINKEETSQNQDETAIYSATLFKNCLQLSLSNKQPIQNGFSMFSNANFNLLIDHIIENTPIELSDLRAEMDL